MPIALRFSIALVLSIACLSMAACDDFQEGRDAYLRGDYATALHEWRPLAEQGNTRAQYYLGVLYANGHGVPQDDGQARQWWEKAAAHGYEKAQYILGVLYGSGYGMPQDLVQAHKWFNLSAAKGDNVGAATRDALAILMTPAQIDEAEKLAREWMPKGK